MRDAFNDSAFDRLTDQSRIRGATRMIAEGTRPEAVTEQNIKDVIAAVRAYKTKRDNEAHPLSYHRIAKAVGYAPATISQVLASKYNGDVREVIIALDRWLDDQIKRDAAPTAGAFIKTKVAEEIMTVADAAVMLGTIGLVYGGTTSGIGKTMALKAIQAEKAGAVMITIEKVEANVTGLLNAIAKAMRMGTGHLNRYMYNRIKDALTDTPRLLLVDQIHNLCHAKGDRPLYVLADLHDATRAPQLWCGTTDIVSYLEQGEGRGHEPLAQIRRRIGIARDLMDRTGPDGGGEPLFSIDEIRKIYGRNKMRLAPDAAQFLYALANVPNAGGLGTCTNLVKMAIAVYEKQGHMQITAEMLRAVQRLMVQSSRCRTLMQKMEAVTPMATAKTG